jgi:glycosyltransferase involved in cell wall biosynthesis
MNRVIDHAVPHYDKDTGTRRTILVIDHAVPHYDKDTGSRNLYQYLLLFARMGLDVKFFGADGIRHEPYTSVLEQQGVEVLSGRVQGCELEAWLGKYGGDIRYAYLLRPYIAGIYMDLVRKHTQAKIIYNGVDFHYLRELRRYELDGDPATLESANRFKEQEFALFAKSDVVYTVSEYEKALLDQQMPGKRVVAIPTYIYDEPFPLGENNGYEERSGMTFVGGFAHQPNTDGILWFTNEIFPLVSRELPEATLTIIGSNPPSEVTALGGDRIKVTGYVSDEELRAYYSVSRIVVAPIRFGAGVKGKIIEASAHGVPIVTTPIGAEGIIEANEIAVSADSPERFADHLIDLYRNRERWLESRNKQIRYAERYLSPDYALSIISQDIGGH